MLLNEKIFRSLAFGVSELIYPGVALNMLCEVPQFSFTVLDVFVEILSSDLPPKLPPQSGA